MAKEFFYTLSKNEPLNTLERIISNFKLRNSIFKLRFVTDLTDTINLYKNLSFLFDEFNFNSQFETRLTYPDLRNFLSKFFMFIKSNKITSDIKIDIEAGDMKIKILDKDKKIVVEE